MHHLAFLLTLDSLYFLESQLARISNSSPCCRSPRTRGLPLRASCKISNSSWLLSRPGRSSSQLFLTMLCLDGCTNSVAGSLLDAFLRDHLEGLHLERRLLALITWEARGATSICDRQSLRWKLMGLGLVLDLNILSVGLANGGRNKLSLVQKLHIL